MRGRPLARVGFALLALRRQCCASRYPEEFHEEVSDFEIQELSYDGYVGPAKRRYRRKEAILSQSIVAENGPWRGADTLPGTNLTNEEAVCLQKQGIQFVVHTANSPTQFYEDTVCKEIIKTATVGITSDVYLQPCVGA